MNWEPLYDYVISEVYWVVAASIITFSCLFGKKKCGSLIGSCCVVLVLLTLQFGLELHDYQEPPGKLFLIESDGGQYHAHLYCNFDTTRDNVTSFALLDSGLPFSSIAFDLVMKSPVSLCTFDRLGYGWSDSGPENRDSITMMHELHQLIEKANLPLPFTYVGWSYGGLDAQIYTFLYPNEVYGLVLADTVQKEFLYSSQFLEELDLGIFMFNAVRLLSPFGISRVFGPLGMLPMESGYPNSSVPFSLRVLTEKMNYQSRFPNTAYKELLYMRQSLQQLENLYKNYRILENKPLVLVLSLDYTENKELFDLQLSLLNMSTRNAMVKANRTDHYIPYWQPSALLEGIELCNKI